MIRVDYKSASMSVFLCSSVGMTIQYFTGFYWLAASLIILIAVMINGLIAFNEDLAEDGFDYQKGITDTPTAKTEQRRMSLVQFGVIALLVVAAIWSYE